MSLEYHDALKRKMNKETQLTHSIEGDVETILDCGFLTFTKEDIENAIAGGALGVSSSSKELWGIKL
mgnify:CR=1 FL=1